MNRFYVVAIIVGLFICGATAMAGIPSVLTYQGMLTDTTGVPLSGALSMTFTIYDDSSGGTPLWSETKTVEVSSGHFKTLLGSISPLDVVYFEGDWRWLEITVAGEIISPRSRLTTSPYAFRPGTIDGATGGTITGALILQGTSVKDGVSDQRGGFSFDPDGAPNDGALVGLTNNAGITTVQLQASEILSQGPGGCIKLYDESGNLTIDLDGQKPGGGSDISFYNLSAVRTMRINGLTQNGTLGAQIGMMEADGDNTIEISAEDDRDGYGPHMLMRDVDGDTAVWIIANGSDIPGTPVGGQLKLYHNNDEVTATLGANYGNDAGGYLRLKNAGGVNTVEIFGQQWSHSLAGEIILSNGAGDNTIRLVGDYTGSGEGRIITEVLEITGGADLSEQFDVSSGHSPDQPEPGMVVVIDPDVPGQLVVSSKAYDPTVAGIISGAGDVNPGMLMGHQGTMADGRHPIALTGRVYCLADASYGAIRSGDLLTTSETPGHAMKAADRDRAYGTVIGKAMTGLDQGRGLILVLVNLQ